MKTRLSVKSILLLLFLFAFVTIANARKKEPVYLEYCQSYSDYKNDIWVKIDYPCYKKKAGEGYNFVPCDKKLKFPDERIYLLSDSEGYLYVNVDGVEGKAIYDRPSSSDGSFYDCVAFTDSSCVMTIAYHHEIIDNATKKFRSHEDVSGFSNVEEWWFYACYLIRDKAKPVIIRPENIDKVLYKNPELVQEYNYGLGFSIEKRTAGYIVPFLERAGLIPDVGVTLDPKKLLLPPTSK